MPVHRCGISTVCLHELRGLKPDEAEVLEYVEVDPTGRYGRYEEVLGKGAFKTVYRAFDQEDGIEVAWNQVEDVLLRTQEDLDRLYSEIDLLSQLKHKNIIKLYHSWVDKKAHTVNFITEIFTSGTLRQYRRKHKHIDIKAVKNWSRQILRGLLYLHSHDPPIIHRDLKCDNIFINGNQGEVKIGDLGLAAILQHTHARSVIGTPEFMAPELYEEEYDELVDIYSFGMCLLEMATAEYPYSECSNAAQIYKKVLTGKKPEALEWVKDPELRHFIEKCLAPASKRLPARELLADPFLDSEGSHSSLEHASLTDRTAQNAIRGKELKLINDDAHTMDTAMQIEYVLEEKLPGMEAPKSSAGSPHIVQNGDWNALQAAAPIPSFPMEDWERYVDFKVDSKGRENDTVFLKFRISGSEGRVRDIHFPFDIESDTAMCVACEMVAELDLTDQDVTKIAEMIDAAIIVLVPEWKAGVAIDEACCEVPDSDIEFVDILDGGSSDGFLKDVLPDASTPEIMSPSGIEGLIDGQAEELKCQFCRSEFLPEVEPCIEQCSVSSDTTDSSKDAGWTLSDISSSNTSQLEISAEQAVAPHFEYAVFGDSIKAKDNRHSPTYFNERLEFERKNGCTNYAYKLWEGFVHEIHDSGHDSILASEYVKEEYDEEADRELAELFIQYEREKQELQLKYKDAVDKVRTRQQQRRNIKSENRDHRYHNACRMLLERSLERLQIEEHLLEAQRNWSCEYPSADGSMTSFEEFSSVDQETPRCT